MVVVGLHVDAFTQIQSEARGERERKTERKKDRQKERKLRERRTSPEEAA